MFLPPPLWGRVGVGGSHNKLACGKAACKPNRKPPHPPPPCPPPKGGEGISPILMACRSFTRLPWRESSEGGLHAHTSRHHRVGAFGTAAWATAIARRHRQR